MSSLRPLRKDLSTAAPVPGRIRGRLALRRGVRRTPGEGSRLELRPARLPDPSPARPRRRGQRCDRAGRMVLISGRAGGSHLLWGLLLVPVWIGLLAVYGLYNRDIKRISHSTVDDIPWILHAVLVGVPADVGLLQRRCPSPSWCSSTCCCSAGSPCSRCSLLRSLTRRLAIRRARRRTGPVHRRPPDGVPDEQDDRAPGVRAAAGRRGAGVQRQRRARRGHRAVRRRIGSSSASPISRSTSSWP